MLKVLQERYLSLLVIGAVILMDVLGVASLAYALHGGLPR